MAYSLYQIDNVIKGDSGGMSLAISVKDDGSYETEHDARPRAGVYMRVGSLYARSYVAQDWWQTNLVTELLEEKNDYVKFRTKSGSVYEWKVIN